MDITAVERAGPVPLVVTADAALRERILLLCAASGVTPSVVDDASEARAEWRSASCVLIGHDAVETLPTDVPLPRRDDVTVVTDALAHDAGVWRGAVLIGAQSVACLPTDQERLVGWLADVAEGLERASTVAVVGARGGVGASTFAATLAVRAARRAPTFLVDADPSGGGVELVIGSEHVDGLRWPDVALTDGRDHGLDLAGRASGASGRHRPVVVTRPGDDGRGGHHALDGRGGGTVVPSHRRRPPAHTRRGSRSRAVDGRHRRTPRCRRRAIRGRDGRTAAGAP